MVKFNPLIPELTVFDIKKSIDFYMNVLQFKLEYERKEDKFAFLSIERSQIMIEEKNGYWETGELIYPLGRGINFQITINNVDELYKNVKESNYPVKMELKENWYRVGSKYKGNKEFLIMDPDGYLLRFTEDLLGCGDNI